MSANLYCWWCQKEWPNSEVQSEWCLKCGHQLGVPPLGCKCLMCDSMPTPPLPEMPKPIPVAEPVVGVDPEKWSEYLDICYAMVSDDAWQLKVLLGAALNCAVALARLASCNASYGYRRAEALEAMADLSEAFATLDHDDDDDDDDDD